MDTTTKTIMLTGAARRKGGVVTKRNRQKQKQTQEGGSVQSDFIVSKFPDPFTAGSDCAIKGYQAPTAVHGAPLSIAFKPVMPNVPESAVSVAASYPAFPQGQPAQQGQQAQAGGAPKVVLVPGTKPKTVHLGSP